MSARYRFLLIQAFHIPKESQYLHRAVDGPKEGMLMKHDSVKHLLENVEWDLHRGPLATYGDWPVETREEFTLVAAGRLPIVREACASGKYNGIVLLGGGEPGFPASREIAREFGIPVVACGFAQMHVASMLGNQFSVIDLAENHNMYYYDLVVQHRFAERARRSGTSIFPAAPAEHGTIRRASCQKTGAARRDVGRAGGCIARSGRSDRRRRCRRDYVRLFGAFLGQPVLQKRLADMGWEVPVLEGYSCAITLCKTMVDLGVDASGLVYPSAHPKKWRRKKLF